jgi:glucose 1-dehydrogenase
MMQKHIIGKNRRAVEYSSPLNNNEEIMPGFQDRQEGRRIEINKNRLMENFMKALAVFPREKKIRIIEQPMPKITTPTQVKVRMLEVGICGTDKEIAAFEYGSPPADSDYLILGHESLAQVAEVGGEVRNLRPGDLVVLTVRRPCRHEGCIACRSGRQDFCYTGDYLERGIKGISGYMAEWVVDEEQYLVPVSDALRDIGILTEPLTIAEKAIEQVRLIQQRLPWGCQSTSGQDSPYCHKAVVLGLGPVGILGAMALSANGFKLYVYSREPQDHPRARVVEAIGGTYVSGENTPVEGLANMVGNIDLVYEATGVAQVSFDMLVNLGINAVFVFTGVPGRKGPLEVQGNKIMRDLVLKNQIVVGTVNAPRQAYEAAVRDLAEFQKRWGDTVKGLIGGRYPMEDYADLLAGKKPGIKNVMKIA